MSLFNHITYMTKNHCVSVDAHLHDEGSSKPLVFSPIKAANMPFMTVSNNLQLRLPMMQTQKSLTFHGRSFSWWGRECANIVLTYKHCHYSHYVQLCRYQVSFTRLTIPTTVDAELTLILPHAYPHYAIIQFGTLHHWKHFGSHSTVFMYLGRDHHIVLQQYIQIYHLKYSLKCLQIEFYDAINILFISLNARFLFHVCLIGCSCRQNGCRQHSDTADSVLTRWCSFIS